MKLISCKPFSIVSYSKYSKLLYINSYIMAFLFLVQNLTNFKRSVFNFCIMSKLFSFSRMSVKVVYLSDTLTFTLSFVTSSGLKSVVIVIILRIHLAYLIQLCICRLFISKSSIKIIYFRFYCVFPCKNSIRKSFHCNTFFFCAPIFK